MSGLSERSARSVEALPGNPVAEKIIVSGLQRVYRHDNPEASHARGKYG